MPTADETVVSLRADFTQYDQQAKSSAAAFQQAVTGVGRAAEGMANATDNAFRRAGQAALDAADKEAQAAQRSEAAQRRKETAQAAWILRAQRATAQFIANQEAEARKAEEAALREARAAEEATRRTLAARNAAGIATGVVGPSGPDRPYGMRGAPGGNFANVSYQLQDIAVQLAGGQQAALVLAQQLPQLLMGFGSLGIVAGTAAAAIGLLATTMGVGETAADRAKRANELFNAIAEQTNDVLTEQEKKFISAARASAEYTANMPDVALTRLEDSARATTTTLEDQRKVIDDFVSGVRSSLDVLRTGATNTSTGEPFAALIGPINELQAKLDPLLQRMSNPNINPAEYITLARQIRDISLAYQETIPDIGVLTGTINDQVTAVASASENIVKNTQQLGELQTRTEAVTRSTEFWAAALRTLIGALGATSSTLGSLGGQLDATIGRFLELARVRGLEANSAYIVATGNDRLAELKEEGRILQGTKESNREAARITAARADAQQAFRDVLARYNTEEEKAAHLTEATKVAQEAYNQSLANSIEREKGSESSKKAHISAAEKQAAAIDKSNLKINQEIDLQERLIRVYHLGAEARAQAQAQYDAENEARNRNIKPTDPAYNGFIRDYTEAAAKKRANEILLDDYAKGEELTKSLRTAQELYNDTIAQYNKWLQEGAINAETYARAVSRLDNETNGYVDAISAIGDAFENGIRSAQDLDNAIISVIFSLVKLIAQAALLGTGPLSKAFDSIFGTVGGIFNLGAPSISAPQGAIGAAGAALSLLPRAEGGQVTPGRGYTVAERGIPEVFFPSVPGQIIPMDRMGGGGSRGDTVILQQRINATGDKQIISAIAQASRETAAATLKQTYKRVQVDSRNLG